jgi:hypothetical protein
MIYLAGPIDRAQSKSAEGVLIEQFRSCGMNNSFFVPKRAFDVLSPHAKPADVKALVDINRFALENCELMLLNYQPGVESWGCPQELMFAWSALVPVVVLVPDKTEVVNLPIYLRAWVKEENFVSGVEDATMRITEILSKPKEIRYEQRHDTV